MARLSRWALTATLLVAWELAGRLFIDDPRTRLIVPLPSGIVAATVGLTLDGTVPRGVARSALRVLIGTGVAVLVGVPLGALLATAPRLGAVLEAPLRLLRPIPPVAWVPLTMVWFGVTELQQVSILALAATFVVASATHLAVRGVPASLVFAAANLGALPVELALRVRVPAALPGVIAAVREGLATAWFVLVAAEFLAASEGIGVLILEGRDMLDPARAFVGMGALAVCGLVSDRVLAALGARWTRWA